MEEKLITGIVGSTLFIVIAIAITIIVIIKYYKSKVAQNEELYNAIIAAQENERSRVAMDIHDSLGGLLGSVKLKLDMMKNAPELIHTPVGENLNIVHSLISVAIKEARNASNALVPEAIKRYGLRGAINDLAKEYGKHFQVQLKNDCPDKLPDALQQHVYRILLELFNNTRKYAQAMLVELDVTALENELLLSYRDDGTGFDFEELVRQGRGNGLKNIRSRVEFLKGKMYLESGNGMKYSFSFKR